MKSIKDRLRGTRIFKFLHLAKGWILFFGDLIRPDSPRFASEGRYKIATIRKYARDFGLNVFVETGTNAGETLDGCRTAFQKLYSVELDDALYQKAKKYFQGYSNIFLFHDDSARFLEKMAQGLDEPVLYWLDAHYSGVGTARSAEDSPIRKEVEACLAHWREGSVILIDDAVCFDGEHESYPSVDELRETVNRRKPNLNVAVKRGIIRIT